MKNYKFLYAFFALLALISCISDSKHEPDNAADETTQNGRYKTVPAFPDLKEFDQPVELTSPEDGTDRMFLVSQKGIIHTFKNKPDVKAAGIFLDITSKVTSGGEMGLLGLAFHPDYKKNGYFYVNYTKKNPLETIISRFKVSASNPNIADPRSELVLLRFLQPYQNHNGGKLTFGNDKYLYIAVGDGGSGGDPKNNGQNRKVLLGKILRIDVDKPGTGINYGIPADNPFKGNTEGNREEIFAYGMRNPWRMNFDRKTGLLWAGDVGQNKIEEIDIIEKGGNYGWRIMEADECFKTDNCDSAGLIKPIWSYRQGFDTGRSVTGGYVCYDKSVPELNGKYIYGDYVSGNIWALSYSGKKAVKNDLVAKLPSPLSSFGDDTKGNLYILSYSPGKVYKLMEK